MIDKNSKLDKIDYRNPNNYYNRECSWMLFNKRVLSEARDRNIALFERIKFLSITASNLDEFFMIRVASLKDMKNAGYTKRDISGLTPDEQLERLNIATRELVAGQYSTYNRSLLPALSKNGLVILKSTDELSDMQRSYLDDFFLERVYPVLTPMAVDSSRPFPLIRNKSLNIGGLVTKKDGDDELEFVTVQVPSVLPRTISIPSEDPSVKVLVLLENVIADNMHKLFLNYDIVAVAPFRIMRNADLTIDEDEAADLLKEIEKQLKKRQRGQIIRLEIDYGVDSRLLKVLKKELGISSDDVYEIEGPLDLTFLMKISCMEGFNELKVPKFFPAMNPNISEGDLIFDLMRDRDILLSHPFESFDPIVDFVQQAAVDEFVLAIKQTLYRVSGNSPIIAALALAAENGKQVTVLVELKARFDEENNIVWARKLEQAGCHVIYGLVGLKTHSKITLIVRQEEDSIRRYVHLGTGNYNDSTAKLYTDIGLLTCKEDIGEDATAFFNMISGYSEPANWNKLVIAPNWMKNKFIELIRREADNATKGYPATIIAKANSLCDQDIIVELYKASRAGVQIDLIIRGVCSLKVGIKGISDNIRVRSIVGFFLEHSRIYYFENNGDREVYCSSADWMPRNLDRRVEILFPIEETDLKKELINILDMELRDNVKAHVMNSEGEYVKPDKRGKELLNSQEYQIILAREAQRRKEEELKEGIFIPRIAPKE